MRVVIVGGGIIGLCTAYYLLSECEGRHIDVVLLERNPKLGLESSLAAAGILFPRPQEDPSWLRAATRSYDEWTKLTRRLKEESGLETGLRETGLLSVVMGDLSDDIGSESEKQGLCERLDRRTLIKREPNLSPEVESAYFYPRAGHVTPSLAVDALLMSATMKGLRLSLGDPVLRILADEGRLRGVQAASGKWEADHVVVTTGAWSQELLSPLGIDVTVTPTKGQALSLVLDRPLFRHVIGCGSIYLTPRPDGTVVVGATQEETGFDKTPTEQATRELMDVALRLVPALGEAAFDRVWAGLRPTTPKRLPMVGPVEAVAGLWVGTGHFSTGILWAPITAKTLSEYIFGGTLLGEMSVFKD